MKKRASYWTRYFAATITTVLACLLDDLSAALDRTSDRTMNVSERLMSSREMLGLDDIALVHLTQSDEPCERND